MSYQTDPLSPSSVDMFPEASNVALTDILYLVQPLQANRDRHIKLAQLAAAIASAAETGKVYASADAVGDQVATAPGYLIDQLNQATNPSSAFGDTVASSVVTLGGHKVQLDILNGAVDTSKLANRAVTPDKIDKTLDYGAKSFTAVEGTGAVPSATMTKDGLAVTDGATTHTEVSDGGIDSQATGSSAHLGYDGLDFAVAGSVETGTRSSQMDVTGENFEHSVSSTTTYGVETTSTRTYTSSAESTVVEQINVTIDPTTSPVYKVTALTRTTTSPEGIIIYAHTTSVQLTEVGGVWTEVAGTTTTSESTSSFKIGKLALSGNIAVAGQISAVGGISTVGNLLAGGKLTVGGNLITPTIGSYTANVDLSTYVVDHNMSVGQHLFVINAGTAEITVTGKVLSGSSEITKTWTLAIGTMCDFVAVPITGTAPNAIAKLG